MGLYDDMDGSVESGDVNDCDFFLAKAFFAAVEEAIKTRQPEDKVGQLCEKLLAAARKALRTFGEHQELKSWVARAEAIQTKIDPRAKPVAFGGDFPFGKDEFTRGYAALQHARFAKEQGDWRTAFEQARTVGAKWYRCTGASKRYSEPWKTLFDEGLLEGKALQKEANTKK